MSAEQEPRMSACQKWVALCESGAVTAEQDTFGNSGPIRLRIKSTGELIGTVEYDFDLKHMINDHKVFFAAMECRDFPIMADEVGLMYDAAEKLLHECVRHAYEAANELLKAREQ